jgi:hypothetical protein
LLAGRDDPAMTVSRRTAVMIGLGVLAAVATAVAFAVPFITQARARRPRSGRE